MAVLPTPTQNKDRPQEANTVGSMPATQASASGGSSVSTTGISVDEYSYGVHRQTVFTLTNVPIALSNTTQYASVHIYDFPLGRIHIDDCVGTIAMTTTSTLTSTLNTGATVQWGIGTAAASASTLATTMQNAMPGSGETPNSFTSSTTINVAATADSGFLAAVSAAHLAAIVNGTVTASKLFFNIGVPTDGDLDADATVTVSGTLYLTWYNAGVV